MQNKITPLRLSPKVRRMIETETDETVKNLLHLWAHGYDYDEAPEWMALLEENGNE